MAGDSGGLKRKPSEPGADPDGVRVSSVPGIRKGVWLVSMGLIAAAAVLLVLLRFGASEPPQPPAAPQPPPAAVAQTREPIAPAPKPTARPPSQPAAETEAPAPPAAAETPAAATPPALPEPPMREDPIVGYGPPGTGIQAFPPPGTSPPLRGLVVPEDFELPEGYVRHHQVTDDGQDLPPILMFHPDYKEWEGPDGQPVAIPSDRVVPPELAPPGMPIQQLEIPDPGDPDAP
jgi:hypothetical protein